jgi:prepilin-type N-terminal cleavage/methylation domain-containing protein
MQNARTSQRTFGLTLLELLVAVVIVSVLLVLVYVGLVAHRRGADELHSKGMMNQISVAVLAYRTEYDEWPPLPSSNLNRNRGARDEWIGDPNMGASIHNDALFFTLRGIPNGPNENHAANSRRVIFFEGVQANFPGPECHKMVSSTKG